MENDWDVIVIGAGAAGLLAAWRAAMRGRRTLVLEKNTKIGVKILMSGGTRCNVTHATSEREIANAFGKNGRFLLSPLSKFGPQQIVQVLDERGVPTKTESTGKIFPVSNRAIHVRDALFDLAKNAGAHFMYPEPVLQIDHADQLYLVETSQAKYRSPSIIITTGGKSYPGCGTTGDGYAWASKFGHSIVDTFPSLAPVVCGEKWITDLKGITIPDATVSVIDPDKKTLGSNRNSLLLTHFGLSGPAAMNASRFIELPPHVPKRIRLDLAPEQNQEQVRKFLTDFRQQHPSQQLQQAISSRWPKRLAEQLLKLAGIPERQKNSEISKAAIQNLIRQIKSLEVSVSGTRGYAKAEVTAGGVALNEVDSKTMQSRKRPGLFFAGEILDLDGPIGGFNFQSAFSTGFVAGENA